MKDIGIDVILDMTGGDFTPKNLRLLRVDGRLIYINAMRGREATVDITAIMYKRIVITGSMLKPRDTAFKSELAADIEQHVWPLITSGALKPLILACFPLADAARPSNSWNQAVTWARSCCWYPEPAPPASRHLTQPGGSVPSHPSSTTLISGSCVTCREIQELAIKQ